MILSDRILPDLSFDSMLVCNIHFFFCHTQKPLPLEILFSQKGMP